MENLVKNKLNSPKPVTSSTGTGSGYIERDPLSELRNRIPLSELRNGIIFLGKKISNYMERSSRGPRPVTSSTGTGPAYKLPEQRIILYNTGFKNKPVTKYSPPRPRRLTRHPEREYMSGVNLMISNLRNEEEFKNLSDEDLKIIASASWNAGNAETGFMGKDWAMPGQTKDKLNKNILDSSPTFGQALAKINKGISNILNGDFKKGLDIMLESPYTGNLSDYYSGNEITRENVLELRRKLLAAGPSVGVSQFKGAGYIIPEKYSDDPLNRIRSHWAQDGINTTYALAKAYNTLKNKHLYYTNDFLNKLLLINFANNPNSVRISRGIEIPIMDKLAFFWNLGAIPSSKTGQTAMTNRRIKNEDYNYSSYPRAWLFKGKY